MGLRFIGIDPSTGGGGSPTVWADEERQEVVIQGWKPAPGMLAEIDATEWVPGHATGVPAGESVVRLPARMEPIVQQAFATLTDSTGPVWHERPGVPDFAALLRSAEHTAVHLELRDAYGVGDEAEEFEEFRRTGHAIVDPEHSWWPEWLGLVRETIGRGVVMRRARVVSEPVTDYIRWEHAVTPLNVASGEQVRWLPRSKASGLLLPANDLWLIDGRRLLVHYWTGEGDWAGHAYTDHPLTVAQSAAAFEQVWDRAIPHDQYAV
ncbi:DUF6879 family protein [Streptacidiphilus anmyonensis]|uniref:DUF6879 family protein n=1 Tax=Streptacidiphilus anmyonensis TaxID=405782 RepID=UPI000A65D696|nr:DUF6879 family protein [Streptacidiphilus anmyonensis]